MPRPGVAEQDRDGVAAEVLYPSVGMLLCNHPDADYKKACFDAYNLWLAEFQSHAPDRLIGLGQTALRSVDEGIDDLQRIKDLGLRGVMLPGYAACSRRRRLRRPPVGSAVAGRRRARSARSRSTSSPAATT